jgi:hypothetical protein
MEQKDYYDIFGLEKDAGQKQVRDAYRLPIPNKYLLKSIIDSLCRKV